MLGLSLMYVEEEKDVSFFYNGYTCKHCGEKHVSDDTELWCLMAKQKVDSKDPEV